MTSPPTHPAPRELPEIEARLVDCAVEGPAGVAKRLRDLEAEWSLERVRECAVGAVTLAGTGVAYFWFPWGLSLTALSALLAFQDATTRAGVLTVLLRRSGWRAEAEREAERSMLKAVRGDFAELPPVVEDADREAIARLEGEGGPVDGPEVPVPVDHEAVRELVERVQRDAPTG